MTNPNKINPLRAMTYFLPKEDLKIRVKKFIKHGTRCEKSRSQRKQGI